MPEFGRDELLQRLRTGRLLILTGAGMSAESGVPTFRDAQTGLWARYKAEDLATPEAFERDPAMVWGWYQWRRQLVAQARPNAGHLALAMLERELAERCTIVTQNVDGLHQLAGATRVVELHGNLMRSICSITRLPIAEAQLSAPSAQPPTSPHHPQGRARPDVVWFGEALPEAALKQAIAATESCAVCLVVGTSGMVYPAAQLPMLAREHGAFVVEINIERSALSSHVDLFVQSSAAQALPLLAANFA